MKIDPNRLDLLLSRGYFRTQQQVFTCRFVQFNEVRYPVHWLRIVLADVKLGPKQNRLFRINASFSVEVKPLIISSELEWLYNRYWRSIDFDAPFSVESCLMDGSPYTLFDSYVVEIRDQGTLIAAGIFDRGSESIAGIMNFYDPDYRKQSLGKYLMLLKVQYAAQQSLTYYYPGYLIGNYPKFDYKLFACEAATEVYAENHDDWFPFSWPLAKVLEAEKHLDF